jgi:hypothetical protein
MNSINGIKFDIMYLEIDKNNYIYSLTIILMIILKNQKVNGNVIIKIDHIFYKPIVDIIYFLTSLYDKVYLIKPNTSNIISFEKYIICKNFKFNDENNNYLKYNYFKLLVFLKKHKNNYISNILDFDIPYHFKIKIDDINTIIGQQQIDAFDQIISIYRNKNKDDKIETLKKINIQRSVNWCEKNKIPYNKFIEKINIFLPFENDLNA